MSVTLHFGTVDDTSPYTPATPAAAVAGDLLTLLVAAFHTSSGSPTITVPGGWTLASRVDQRTNGASTYVALAVYTKTAELSDLGATHTVTFDGSFSIPSGNTTVVLAASGAGGIGTPVASGRDSGASDSYAPAIVAPTLRARGMILHGVQANMAAPLATANGWSSVGLWGGNAFHLLTLPDIDPPHVAPVLTATTAGRAHIAWVFEYIAPVAAFAADIDEGDYPLLVEFDGSSSSDADGTIVSWSWDFGGDGIDTGESVTHTFADAGTYSVVLTVTDDSGLTDTATLDITVTTPDFPPGSDYNGGEWKRRKRIHRSSTQPYRVESDHPM